MHLAIHSFMVYCLQWIMDLKCTKRRVITDSFVISGFLHVTVICPNILPAALVNET